MTQPEKQKAFLAVIAKMKKSVAFAEAMASEAVTTDTALTLMQLAEDAHRAATVFRTDLLQDRSDRQRG